MSQRELKNEVHSIDINNIMNDINLQTKTISLLLDPLDHVFREQIIDIIHIDYFESVYHKLVLKYAKKYIDKYNTIPGRETLKQTITFNVKDKTQLPELHELVDIIFDYEVKDKEFIVETTLDFFRKQSLKKSLLKAAEQFDIGNFNEISNTITNAMKKFEPKSKGHNYFRDFLKRMEDRIRNPVACFPGLDEYIRGGLAGGELAIVLSPTGGGKSMFLVKIGAEAFRSGKKVVYYSLELNEVSIGNRFDACLNNVPITYVNQYKDNIEDTMKNIHSIGGDLNIVEYLNQKPTVNTLRNHLTSMYRESGFKPDIIIVDYADLMKPTTHYSEKRHSLTDIYENLRNLGNEFNVPIWTASQVNRSGYNNEDFSLANIAEDIGKANTADLILGVARTNASKVNKVAKLLVMKNRNGSDGFALDMIFDTSKVQLKITSPDKDSGKIHLDGLNLEKKINN